MASARAGDGASRGEGNLDLPDLAHGTEQRIEECLREGVEIIAYDAEISEPCAYNVSIDQTEAGRVTAEWPVEKLNGKGNVVITTGVPGTSVDTLRTKAAKEVFAKYPDIHVISEG